MCTANDKGAVACVKVLLQRDSAAFNERDKEGCTVLHRAVGNGAIKGVKLLAKVKNTVDLNIRDKAGRAALHWACVLGQDKAVRALVLGGCDVLAADEALGATGMHVSLQHHQLACASEV